MMGTGHIAVLLPDQEHLKRTRPWGGNIMHEPDVKGGGDVPYWRKKVLVTNTDATDSSGDASTSEQWPPRSYMCNFCRREFRTAQGLGGHMNVHRRERAQANQLAHLTNSNEALLASTNSQDANSATCMQGEWKRGYYNYLNGAPLSQQASTLSSNQPLGGILHSSEKPGDTVDLELRLGQKSD
ncbi:transcriptional regulator TAC1 [Physcomitrium patens]|uniref:C2H2-type domain-containing protein n=1 Tax=Physcomitrium patens TaxID=3218 RepID=A0A2K1L7I0_PHYPA|nr:zinc finger protein 2-like [Physcomitrium patens]PNR61954.1 hypothetical protein PHYPA_000378 [Physcomitrium patens]|eukprot:XP_024371225.1 zinc finger protein 2-like [Physcomitrella patens]